MAEKSKSQSKSSVMKKPQSLNDRHYRFLQELSTPRPTSHKPSFSLTEEEEESPIPIASLEGSKQSRKASPGDNIPKFSFSGISDTNSPIPEKVDKPSDSIPAGSTQYEEAYSEAQGADGVNSQLLEATEFYSLKEEEEESPIPIVSAEGSRQSHKASHDDSIPKFSFSGISDIDSPIPEKVEKSSDSLSGGNTRYEEAYSEAQGADNVNSQLSETTKFYSLKEEEVKSSNGFFDGNNHSEEAYFEARGADEVNPQLSEATEFYFRKDKEATSNSLSDHSSQFEEAYSKAEGEDSESRLSDVTDFHSTKEEEKPVKVKIHGRRRLCKVSARDDDGFRNKNSINTVGNVEPEYLDASDLDLMPPPAKPVTESKRNDGASEIRDILDDLSSRLDFLSIEKKRAPKGTNPVRTSVFFNDGEVEKEKKFGIPNYESAESSFSSRTDKSVSSFDVARMVNTYVSERGVEKQEAKGRSTVYEIEDDNDDDCMILSGTKMVKKNEIPRRKFHKYDDTGLVDVADEFDENLITMPGPKGTYKLPGKIAKMLYPHQRDGLKWLWSLHCKGKGGILGDDMGLGKTMQICGYLVGLFHSNLIKRVLIVAPKTLLSHWVKELSVVGLSSKTREYYGTCVKTRNYELQYILQDKGILLTTYDIVRNNTKSLKGYAYLGGESEEDETIWDYMILDEGHLIKNPSTQRAKSLLEIPSAHRIIISGTPIQNNLKELWALFNFCCPELLGDKKWFKEKYEFFILRGNEKNASEREKRIGTTVAKELRERIQPFFLRRLKSEVFKEEDSNKTTKLSKKNEIVVWLKLTGCQRKLYEAFLKTELVLSAFDGSPLAALTILKKICDHPLLLTKRAAEDVLEGLDSESNPQDVGMAEELAMRIADVDEIDDFQEKHDNISCKLSFILSLLNDLIPKGHSVLIFSQTRKMLNLIQDSLVSNGYEFLRIDGTTKAGDRSKIVNDFQEGYGAPIFLLTSQVGGLGLTLTRADRVIVVDPAWNPSTDSQSVDRAYRIGQKKDVIVYRLMTCGTVEEKIYRMQIFKGGLFKTATEHKEQMRYFSRQDLKDIFSLPKDGFDVSPTQIQLHEEHGNQIIMDDYLAAHVEFLETLDIAGVSHHNLLFSKTTTVEAVEEDQEIIRRPTTFVGSWSSRLMERPVDGAEYAFKPKDVNLNTKATSPNSAESADKLSESGIKSRISRLSHMLSNADMVSRLPDKGEKLRRQINELNEQLMKLKVDEGKKPEVIDLDDITGKLHNVLNISLR